MNLYSNGDMMEMPGHGGMDHGGMDHGGMDHGGMDHGDGGMDMSMDMLWNWNTRHFMVVFELWHVKTGLDFALTLLAVFLLALAYERLQGARAAAEQRAADLAKKATSRRALSIGSGDEEPTEVVVGSSASNSAAPLLSGTTTGSISSARQLAAQWRHDLTRTALFMASNFLSIFLMLVFMTFNGWLILMAVAGAGTGFYLFRRTPSRFGLDKGSCCE
ncbi:hypothetical protein AMAG_13819 [Allomyces macrogynus ATCC 38327]|uniref:Copper transport protein n=1 Tax=Allomyces macrogynus (strain ATCC 38327) TaxID=578462 RepID=A0A0L0T2H6_ALLM3|nr:hypothetical protein AMAG_13819 [Allomyces macrogynus ATCC 38327]|eukprot:KNE68946.1 hypothetical protein AMAG_13819 [Allomyces macrogynus ATCC 38327]